MKATNSIVSRRIANAIFVLVVSPAFALGQLRVVSYNTAGGPRAGLDTVLAAIGDESVGGIAKPIDVLALQEQSSWATTTQEIVGILNDIYGAGTYASANTDGITSGGGRPGLIYNTTTVELHGQVAFGTVNTSNQARQTLRYQLRPVGYGGEADFFVYNNHYKASSGSSNEARRSVEAMALRANVDALGDGVLAIFAGDYNIRDSDEMSYQTLLGDGAGKAYDPANAPGDWHDDAAFRHLHTQAPNANPSGGLIGGGVDDRFDFQLITGEWLNEDGLDYINGSYRVFGNNGTHALNGSINTGTGASPEVLVALMTASDHLPVVADYQLPAAMQVQVGATPATALLGSIVDIPLSVENIASVVSTMGADELDYSISVVGAGSIVGGATGSLLALAGAADHVLRLDTSIAGMTETRLIVEALDLQTANRSFELAISYEVLAMFAADFDNDGDVDGDDFLAWQGGFGMASGATQTDGDYDNDGDVDGDDFLGWQSEFGSGGAAAQGMRIPHLAVPEPSSAMLFLVVCTLIVFSRRRARMRPTRFRRAFAARRFRLQYVHGHFAG